MQTPAPSTLMLLALVPLLLWRIHARFRRLIGRQRTSRIRPWITIAIFSVLSLLLVLAGMAQPQRLWWLAAGLACGGLLSVAGLRITRYEPTPQGLFYTPNAPLGIALSLLFVARILYRFVEIHGGSDGGLGDFARSSLTLAAFGLPAGYYIGYAVGLIRWRQRVLRAKREREARAGEP